MIGKPRVCELRRCYLGPGYGDGTVAGHARRPRRECTAAWTGQALLAETVSHLIATGTSSAGTRAAWSRARALGHRSILGDPRHPEMRDIRIEDQDAGGLPPLRARRCSRRPARIASSSTAPPLHAAGLPRSARTHRHLPAITHVDATPRIQTIDRPSRTRSTTTLDTFRRAHRGARWCINTAMNVRGEPMVTPLTDAWQAASCAPTWTCWSPGPSSPVRTDGTEGDTISLTALPAESNMVDPTLTPDAALSPTMRTPSLWARKVLGSEPDLQVGDQLVLDIDGREQAWRWSASPRCWRTAQRDPGLRRLPVLWPLHAQCRPG